MGLELLYFGHIRETEARHLDIRSAHRIAVQGGDGVGSARNAQRQYQRVLAEQDLARNAVEHVKP